LAAASSKSDVRNVISVRNLEAKKAKRKRSLAIFRQD